MNQNEIVRNKCNEKKLIKNTANKSAKQKIKYPRYKELLVGQIIYKKKQNTKNNKHKNKTSKNISRISHQEQTKKLN